VTFDQLEQGDGTLKCRRSAKCLVVFGQRIDADEIRSLCPGYTGADAHVFQEAATKGVHILYDYALRKGINIILDGTFAYGNALDNIERRNVSKEVFIKSSVRARHNVNAAKEKFCNKLELNLLIKDFETDFEQLELNIDKIDPYLKQVYSEDELVALIS